MRRLKPNRTGAGILLALVFISLAFALTRPPQDPFAADAVTERPFPSLTYGLQAFLWWDTGHVGLHLDWTLLLTFTHVKQTFSWRDMEPNPGEWHFDQADRLVDEVTRRGLKLVARLGTTPPWAYSSGGGSYLDTPPDDLADWAHFCGVVAERYRGRIMAYQIWNEPNLAREWGGHPPDAAAYVELLAACSAAIRATDPDAVLISAGLAPTGTYDDNAHPDDIYLQAMYDAGFQQYIDVVGVHAPGYAPPTYGPDDAERDGIGRWASFRRVEDLRRIMVASGDAARQIAILEVGWTTDPDNPVYSWFSVSEEQQAQYLVEAYQYAADNWRPWVGLMSLIYLPEPNWTEANEEYWWAISVPGRGHRPAFFALSHMPKYCDDYFIPQRAPDSPEYRGEFPTDPCP